jgi:hypothetical protein
VEEDTWERVAAIARRFELKGLGGV